MFDNPDEVLNRSLRERNVAQQETILRLQAQLEREREKNKRQKNFIERMLSVMPKRTTARQRAEAVFHER